ncbi:NAD(P)-binding domain-containing protein [Ectobacillus sp. JY-23]|uniref:FAD-dependent oxidoreductase n=1 Tax=Ectobacillus sp. JY-23 TaxID=2933872 RepID=UPI001FF21C79|nr:FAD-dependent oxidoreductase [Ectobacillus sp. JY-23]UOY92387.1 NAD(P)-binding domain-containing protein [Ectobacillus sp. JY-23]
MKPIQLQGKNTQGCCTTSTAPVLKNMQEQSIKHLPVAIIGAGPVGLAAAAHLAKRGEAFLVLEAGFEVAANILTWGHVRLFSPWRYNMDKAAVELLEKHDWKAPDLDQLPTGKELIENYLQPLSNLPEIHPYLHQNTKVLGISRKYTDKMKTSGREQVPFTLYAEKDGVFTTYEVRAVLDASGTWGNPNPANSSGVWLEEEKSLQQYIFYGIPEILGSARTRYKNKRIAVVGGGHSAINTLLELAELKEMYPKTDIVWIMRRQKVEEAYGGEEKDALAARGALGSRVHEVVDSGKVKVMTPFQIQRVSKVNNVMNIHGNMNGKEQMIANVDEIIVNTGSRPNLDMLRELRTSIDTTTESVEALAPLIDPNVHSCGTVRAHGEKELRQPEKDLYILGSKSYGRAPTFLMATGYEQVRSVVAHLTRDYEAASKVELDLPETGVCSTNLNTGSSCC